MEKLLIMAYMFSVLLVDTDGRSLRLVRQVANDDIFGFGRIIRKVASNIQSSIAKVGANTVKSARIGLPFVTPLIDGTTGALMNNLPFCGNSARGLCKFMTCALTSLKDPENLEHLQLLNEIIADPELRASVVESPEVIEIYCQASNIDPLSCKTSQTLIELLEKTTKPVLTENNKGSSKKRLKRSNHGGDCDEVTEYGGHGCVVLTTAPSGQQKAQDDQINKPSVKKGESTSGPGDSGEALELAFDGAESMINDDYYSSLIRGSDGDYSEEYDTNDPVGFVHCRKYL